MNNFKLNFQKRNLSEKKWLIKQYNRKERIIEKIAINELKGLLHLKKLYIINCNVDDGFLTMTVGANKVIDSIVEVTKSYKNVNISVSEIKDMPLWCTEEIPTLNTVNFSFSFK